MKRLDGEKRADYNYELDVQIIYVIQEKKHLPTFRIAERIEKTFGRKYNWRTIRNHIDNLVKKEELKIIYQTEPDLKRSVKVYGIA